MRILVLFLLTACATKSEQRLQQAQRYLAEGKIKQATKILTMQCEMQDPPACSMLGGVLHREQVSGYVDYYRKGCDLKDGLGCFGLASVHYKKQELPDFEKNINLSCLYGFTEACRVIKQLDQQKSETKTK